MEYNEDSDNFKILTIIHVKYAGIFCGLLGKFQKICPRRSTFLNIKNLFCQISLK